MLNDSCIARAGKVLEILSAAYPVLPEFLEYRNGFELLICVILSAQTTDLQVNKASKALFARFPDPFSLAKAELADLEELVKSTGYFRIKASRIREAAKHLVVHHLGKVPATMEELVKIPGVGRKSAGVVLFHVFGKPALIVDTHFGRVCRRLGFSTHNDPEKLEQDVAKLFPVNRWGEMSMLINLHGRKACLARKPQCLSCMLRTQCPSRSDP